ncbi:hypothetical protein JSY14_02970 [Brachybacterium sp. EF45031]|uniref:TIGR03089 family protein n=1 Tax=Brachybacterium sillae TaxID=2810536 RepID=UPI00217F0E81|nr:TIGR03089 family protein [Brachybacterium sillae]MCS6711027.1 hypothetical protein [Brachybacterium sillae]
MTTVTLRRGDDLLRVWEGLGPRPALVWYGADGRIELSGHVLANWVTKAIGHLHDEVMLAPGATVQLDLPPHWRRMVLALASWSLGAQVVLGAADTDPEADPAQGEVVATDHPQRHEDAEDLLVLEPLSLAPQYSGELPPLARDWAQEVRSAPDRLMVTLPAWSGPAPDTSTVPTAVGADGRPLLLVDEDGLDRLPAALAVWAAGGVIIGPSAGLSHRSRRDEGLEGLGEARPTGTGS